MIKLFGLCCALALFACTKDKIAGTISSTDTGISGKVIYASGKAATNAQVKLFITRDTSRTALSQIATNTNGGYTFDSLASGSYNVWIESNDSLVAFIDSIYVPINTQVKRDATLGKSGSVTAVVGLQTGHDPRSVFVQALGTQKYSNVDSFGRFTLANLAEGEYTLRLVSTIVGYTPTYTTITIASGINDTLKDTIKLIYTGIPPVAGIEAEYDPFTGIAKISWSTMAYANLYDYKIYRDVPGSVILSSAPIAASTDTVFYDTLFGNPATALIGWPDSSIGNANIDTSSTSLKYRYRVTIRNKSNQEGQPYNFADINGTNPLNLTHILYPADNAKFVNGTNLSVSWNAVVLAQNYQIHISSKPDFSDTILIATITDSVKALPTLSLGYYYSHVRAQGPKGQWGFWSVPKKFVVNGGLFANTLGQSVNFSADKVIKANDGGYLILGYTFNPIDDSRFLYIVKADSLGNELWHQAYTLQWMGMITDAFQTDDNGYIILGHGLLKINQSGTTVWSKSANDTSAFSSGMTETSIIKTPDNGFIVGANLSDNPIKFFPYTTHILKFNGTGIKQWDHKIDTTSEPFIVTMGVDSFATIGLKMFDASGGNFPDTLVINIFDYSGNTKISRRLHIPTMQSIRSAIRTTMGTISVSGSYMASMINYITKISADWNNISSETLTETNFGSIQPLSDGGYLHISAPLQGLFNWSITKVDITGSTLWNKKTPVGFESFIAEPDGAIVAVHSGYSINDGVLLYKISMDGISFEQ